MSAPLTARGWTVIFYCLRYVHAALYAVLISTAKKQENPTRMLQLGEYAPLFSNGRCIIQFIVRTTDSCFFTGAMGYQFIEKKED